MNTTIETLFPASDLPPVATVKPKATRPRSQACEPATVPVYGIRLVRESLTAAPYGIQVHSPRDIYNIVAPLIEDADREQFVVLFLNTKGSVTGVNIASVGDLSSAIVHPREVFKGALLASAASVIVCHNHPSGDPSPSPEDCQVTRRLVEAGEIIGVEVLDHVVIGERRWCSLKERGLM